MSEDGYRDGLVTRIEDWAKAAQVDRKSVDELISSLHIVGDRVASFKYITMQQKLKGKDYADLLYIIGFDPYQNRDFVDCECSHGVCVANIGHACDPVACRGRAKQ